MIKIKKWTLKLSMNVILSNAEARLKAVLVPRLYLFITCKLQLSSEETHLLLLSLPLPKHCNLLGSI